MTPVEEYIQSNSTEEDPLLAELYRETHIRFINPNMSAGHIQGLFLQAVTEMIKPSAILEIGTYTGYSAICMARALKEGGKLYTIELNDELYDFSREYFVKAGLEEKIIQMTGNALQLINDIEGDFDLVYIDGDKREYVDYFNLVFPRLRPGGWIIADNTLWGEKVVLNRSSDPQTEGLIRFNEMIRNMQGILKVVLPLRDGITLIRNHGQGNGRIGTQNYK